MWFGLIVAFGLIGLLAWAAVFDRRRRAAGRQPGDPNHADTRRRDIRGGEGTVQAEIMRGR